MLCYFILICRLIVNIAANRLDMPTSGLMFIGLNVDGARRLWADTAERRVQKEYLCRVVGKFPE